jgi:sugar lactone lactonase YvrE
MKANAKSKARSLITVGIVVGTISASAIVAACSATEAKQQPSDDNAPAEGIGLKQIDAVANAPESAMPVDATPSPDGKDVYFIAFSSRPDADGLKKERVPAIYKTSSTPGAAPQKLFEGSPLNSPFGITISDDGQTLFIADSSADGSSADPDVEGAARSDGRVFAMSTSGGTPTALAGTEGIAPAGIEAMGASLFVTGRKDGKAGLFKTGIGGGAVSAVAVGAPFADPGGVAVTRDGVAYVVDTGSSTFSTTALASVVKVTADGKTEILMDGLSVGHPAGIALVNDESAVIVSALDSATGTDRVYRIELGDHTVTQLSTTIGAFYESAGLHRARNAEVFAWADSHANKHGTVYVLKP